jgi:hypothetical protein
MKRKLLIAVPLLILVAAVAWALRPKHESVGEAYISERSITLWSSVAQVREPLDTLRYGDRVEVMSRRNDSVKVRAANGEIGWIDGRQLLEPALWERSIKLLQQAQTIPVQAHGRTKVQTNLRMQPGRTEPRLYQFGRGVPVEVVGRAVADMAPATDEKEPANDSGNKKEDWYLVRAVATRPPGDTAARTAETNTTTQPGDQSIPIAGWVVSRFVELDLPDPVREGIASANVRAVAWFELSRVADASGEKVQYLVAGSRGPEGQPCDFTTLRVYTWDAKKARYETAFIENNLCGALPIHIGKGPKDEPEFRLRVMDGDKGERVYRLIQTVVRRIRAPGEAPSRPSHAKPAKAAAR